jgi:hypothetical protein
VIPMGITTGVAELVGRESRWFYVLAIPLFTIFVPLGVTRCWRSLRRNRQNLANSMRALEVIRQYVTLLESMEIIVQQEFTQLKSAPVDKRLPFAIALKPLRHVGLDPDTVSMKLIHFGRQTRLKSYF